MLPISQSTIKGKCDLAPPECRVTWHLLNVLGRKSHRMDQSNTHTKIANEISNVKSLLDNSTQQTKELKAQLNELTEKKKDAGKSPRNLQAPPNRFNTPIPKIQGLFINTVLPTTTNNLMSASVTLGGPSSDMQLEDRITSPSESFDFDLDLFSEMLENETIPEPTGAELAAHAFLRTALGK